MKQYATWELKNIIKALSIMSVLNTDEENKRLEAAKQELKNRGKEWETLQFPGEVVSFAMSISIDFKFSKT